MKKTPAVLSYEVLTKYDAGCFLYGFFIDDLGRLRFQRFCVLQK